jgi:hypothetical protein
MAVAIVAGGMHQSGFFRLPQNLQCLFLVLYTQELGWNQIFVGGQNPLHRYKGDFTADTMITR